MISNTALIVGRVATAPHWSNKHFNSLEFTIREIGSDNNTFLETLRTKPDSTNISRAVITNLSVGALVACLVRRTAYVESGVQTYSNIILIIDILQEQLPAEALADAFKQAKKEFTFLDNTYISSERYYVNKTDEEIKRDSARLTYIDSENERMARARRNKINFIKNQLEEKHRKYAEGFKDVRPRDESAPKEKETETE